MLPRSYPLIGTKIEDFVLDVRERSAGRLLLEPVWTKGADTISEFTGEQGILTEVSRGSTPIAVGSPLLWRSLMPASIFFGAVPFGLNADEHTAWMSDRGQELYDELYASRDMKPFIFGSTGSLLGTWSVKKFDSFAEWKDLNFRLIYLGYHVAERAGAKPHSMHFAAIGDALRRGALDATESVGFCHDFHFGIPDIAHHLYLDSWQRPNTNLEIIVNRAAWDGLPIELRATLSSCIAASTSKIRRLWEQKEATYKRKILESRNIAIHKYPREILARLAPIGEDIMAEAAGANAASRKIYDSYQTIRRRRLTAIS